MSTVEADCEARLTLGQKPDRFWIGALGDYGHVWPDKGETYGGTINISALEKEIGRKPTADDFEHEERRAFHREAISPQEHVLYRLWKHFHPLTSDLWRVYGGIDYAAGYQGRLGTWMQLSIEYRFSKDDDTKKQANMPPCGGQQRESAANPAYARVNEESVQTRRESGPRPIRWLVG